MNVAGKVAVITGASRGVGRATAEQLARLGCHVVINYSRSEQAAAEVASAAEALGVKAICVAADVADDAACRMMMQRAADELGGIDILVNNAGTTQFIGHSDMEAVNDEAWDRIFAVNVKGPFQCIRAAQPHLRRAGNAEIINVSSIAGLGFAGSSIPYCASKAAVINMTVNLARALGPEIRVNSIAPGFIDGEWTRSGLGANYEQVAARAASESALNRICVPDDIAEAIVSLITGSDALTGQTIVVDAGKSVGAK